MQVEPHFTLGLLEIVCCISNKQSGKNPSKYFRLFEIIFEMKNKKKLVYSVRVENPTVEFVEFPAEALGLSWLANSPPISPFW